MTSGSAMRIAAIANQLFIEDAKKFKEAGLLDKIVMMVPGLSKIAPDFVKEAERSDLSDELMKKAKIVGDFLGDSKIGAHIKTPAKRPAELTQMSTKSIVSTIDHLKEVISNILSGNAAQKLKSDPGMKSEVSQVLKVAKDMDEIKKGILEMRKNLYSQFGALEKEMKHWEASERKINERAISNAEKEIKKYLGQVYAALFGPAISNHLWGFGVTMKPKGASVKPKEAYEEGTTEPLEEEEDGVTIEIGCL